MKIRELVDYLTTLPNQDDHVALAEWREDGFHMITPPNFALHTWKTFERFGRTFQPILHWDNCHAHKINENRLGVEAELAKSNA